MGINVVLRDEWCNDVSDMALDPGGVVTHSLPALDDGSYCCIRFIDPYGDTVFNNLQAKVMIGEWDRLRDTFSSENAEELWAEIRELIVRCSKEIGLYLRFVGD